MSDTAQPMPAEERSLRARSFAGVASEYDRGRPGYPLEAIEWILGSEPLEVLDLAAGTGKLTDAIVAAGHRTTAVEPLPEMRSLLESRRPSVAVLPGTAEEIPLEPASVDAVLVGAAFHWFDQERALAEIGRVLRAPGVLALLGNSFDVSIAWQAELREILGPPALGRRGHWPEPERLEALFEDVQERSFAHSRQTTLELLRDYASSRSSFAILPESERHERLAELDDLWRRTPELGGAATGEIRWISRVARCRGLRVTAVS